MAKGINQLGCSGLDSFYLAQKQPLNFVAKADRLKDGGFNLTREINVEAIQGLLRQIKGYNLHKSVFLWGFLLCFIIIRKLRMFH